MNRAQRSSPTRQRSNGSNALNSAHLQTGRQNGAVTAAQFKRLSERVERMEGELDDIKSAWEGMGTSREQIEKNGAELGVQFQRIAMMQAEIDRLKTNEAAVHAEIARLSGQLGARRAKQTTPKL